jgi:hypothetical protein
MFQGQDCNVAYQLKIKPCELEYYLEMTSFSAFNYLHAELSKFTFVFFFFPIDSPPFPSAIWIEVSGIRLKGKNQYWYSCAQGKKADVPLPSLPLCDF